MQNLLNASSTAWLHTKPTGIGTTCPALMKAHQTMQAWQYYLHDAGVSIHQFMDLLEHLLPANSIVCCWTRLHGVPGSNSDNLCSLNYMKQATQAATSGAQLSNQSYCDAYQAPDLCLDTTHTPVFIHKQHSAQ